MAVGHMAETALLGGMGRKISREEAIAIIEENQKEGMVLQPSNTEKIDFLCSCCGCCCGMLRMQKSLPRPVDFWASNFLVSVDENRCIGCGVCGARCQVDAIRVSPKTKVAQVDHNRCIGCGLCVTGCPETAITLIRKATEVKPPETREDLLDIIMANKKGTMGKLKLTGKLILDTIRTGRIRVVK
jgi:Pyruvate/2-oxoacid:ferredoxin oxidoreductase delta subunit